MQPYFFPYLGYFSLIKHTDKFILFDAVQFIRHGWIERNRVLKQNGGWLYLQVPILNKSREVIIKDLLIDNSQDWKEKIFAQLQPYKKVAPYYFRVIKMLNEILENEYETIVDLNFQTIKHICAYLSIGKEISVFSQMNLDIEQVTSPDEWALNICKRLKNVDEYWNPPGGQSFFDKSKYDSAGIDLKFQTVDLEDYEQNREDFEPGLSIIDVIMFNSPEEVNKMLDKYELS
jgi:hypothetical protein